MVVAAGPKYCETFVVDVDRWNPWRALRERDDLVFGLCRLPAGIRGLYLPDTPKSFVLIDDGLDQSWRNAVLAHELVHHERGGGCVLEGMPASWAAMAARDESQVWREVARRLCPAEEMRAVAELARVNELPFETWEVAEQFDVPHFVAVLAAERNRSAAERVAASPGLPRLRDVKVVGEADDQITRWPAARRRGSCGARAELDLPSSGPHLPLGG